MPYADHVSLERATLLLKQILAARSPELGARLKQRLTASLREQGLPPFDERAFGYKSFQVFLEKTQSDWLSVTRPTEGPGDIIVSLHGQQRVAAALPARAEPPSHFRNEVWQAFTNPDSSRKRYLHKRTGEIVHFKAGERSQHAVAYSDAPDDYAEIEFIDGSRQREWMEEYLNAVPVVGDERQAYESMMAAPYSSAMNVAFTRALGDKQEQWREFRTSRVVAAITEWASKHSVPIELLERDSPTVDSKALHGQTPAHAPRPAHAARHDALKLLELLTDQEINSIVLPVLLSTMLLRTRG
jgi:hypothetical protein